MRAAALLAALALVAAPALPQETQPEQGQVWKGTLGDTPITACFFGEDSREGVFYADAALEPVRLESQDENDPSALREMRGFGDPTGAEWSLTMRADGRIEGQWSKGEERLPIRLTALPVTLPDYGTPCETGAFLDPLLAGGTVTSKRESLDGTAYTVREYTGPKRAGLDQFSLVSFALDPVRSGDDAINAALARHLPDGTANSDMGACFGSGLRAGMGTNQDSMMAPLLITSRWLGVRYSGSDFCGGAHPNHYILMDTYDRESGAAVDPAAWFGPGALTFYEFDTIPAEGRRAIAGVSAALLRALSAHYPEREDRAECLDIMREDRGWQIGLTRAGPVFVPQMPHAAFGCTEEIVLPWREARPFLSPEGRAVMASLK